MTTVPHLANYFNCREEAKMATEIAKIEISIYKILYSNNNIIRNIKVDFNDGGGKKQKIF